MKMAPFGGTADAGHDNDRLAIIGQSFQRGVQLGDNAWVFGKLFDSHLVLLKM